MPVLHVEVHGTAGPFVLLVHGILASRAQWLRNLDALSAVARPVVVELLGHGRSPSPEDPAAYAPSGYLAEFERVRKAVGADRWVVCGQSLGAALTLRYALVHSDRVVGQVFTNSNSALAEPGWVERTRPELDAIADRLEIEGRSTLAELSMHPSRGRRLPGDVRDALTADAELHEPAGVARTFRHTVPASPVHSLVATNRVPALLVVGRHERGFAPARRYAEAVMPQLTVVEADAGHAVNAEDAPCFNTAVAAFLDDVRRRPRHA
jgi:pimeloyl-ACP methyl ester carboxylesterase